MKKSDTASLDHLYYLPTIFSRPRLIPSNISVKLFLTNPWPTIKYVQQVVIQNLNKTGQTLNKQLLLIEHILVQQNFQTQRLEKKNSGDLVINMS